MVSDDSSSNTLRPSTGDSSIHVITLELTAMNILFQLINTLLTNFSASVKVALQRTSPQVPLQWQKQIMYYADKNMHNLIQIHVYNNRIECTDHFYGNYLCKERPGHFCMLQHHHLGRPTFVHSYWLVQLIKQNTNVVNIIYIYYKGIHFIIVYTELY